MSTTAIGVVEAFGCQIQNLEYNALLTKSSCFEEFLVFHQVYEARWGGRPRWLTFFSSLIWTWHGWVMLMYKTHVLADLLHACQFQHPFCVQSPFSACLDHGFWAFLINMKKRVHWGLLVDLSLRLGSPRGKKRILMLESRFTFEHASFFFIGQPSLFSSFLSIPLISYFNYYRTQNDYLSIHFRFNDFFLI